MELLMAASVFPLGGYLLHERSLEFYQKSKGFIQIFSVKINSFDKREEPISGELFKYFEKDANIGPSLIHVKQ